MPKWCAFPELPNTSRSDHKMPCISKIVRLRNTYGFRKTIIERPEQTGIGSNTHWRRSDDERLFGRVEDFYYISENERGLTVYLVHAGLKTQPNLSTSFICSRSFRLHIAKASVLVKRKEVLKINWNVCASSHYLLRINISYIFTLKKSDKFNKYKFGSGIIRWQISKYVKIVSWIFLALAIAVSEISQF